MDPQKLYKESLKYSEDFVNFLNQSYSVYHISALIQKTLDQSGYTKIKENEQWNLKKGGKYYFQRNQTAVVAFSVGNNFDENNTGFKIIGSHLDSPCLQLAPMSKLKQVGYNQSCIQTYGGGSWHAWFDRDLNVAGKIICQDPTTKKFSSKLWNSKKPLMKIPNLAIHLETSAERSAFSVNTETQLRPIISTETLDSIFNITGSSNDTNLNQIPCAEKHYSRLMNIISTELGIDKSTIYDMALQLNDATEANIMGIYDEFISGERIDDLICAYAALRAFIENTTQNKKYVDVMVIFDHEEIGSQSAYGAKSTMTYELVERIMANLCTEATVQKIEKAKARSFIVSSDVAHAIHPNYQDRTQINSQNKINEGINVKFDPKQNYASSCNTRSIIYEVGKRANVPILDCIKPNNVGGGSTIGPIVSSNTSIRTADIGPAILGMHSIRETAGTIDAYYNYLFDKTFYAQFESIENNEIEPSINNIESNSVQDDDWELIQQL